MLFLTSHLRAGQENLKNRVNEYYKILDKIKLPKEAVKSPDLKESSIFWDHETSVGLKRKTKFVGGGEFVGREVDNISEFGKKCGPKDPEAEFGVQFDKSKTEMRSQRPETTFYENENKKQQIWKSKNVAEPEKIKVTQFLNQFDYVFWMGDLNFRSDYDETFINDIHFKLNSKDPVKQNQAALLLKQNDQLKKLRDNNSAFSDFKEAAINFLPTYKFNAITNTYQTVLNDGCLRMPSFTDRILYRSNHRGNLKCLEYNTISSMEGSDHKPVYGVFECDLLESTRTKVAVSAGFFHRNVLLQGMDRGKDCGAKHSKNDDVDNEKYPIRVQNSVFNNVAPLGNVKPAMHSFRNTGVTNSGFDDKRVFSPLVNKRVKPTQPESIELCDTSKSFALKNTRKTISFSSFKGTRKMLTPKFRGFTPKKEYNRRDTIDSNMVGDEASGSKASKTCTIS